MQGNFHKLKFGSLFHIQMSLMKCVQLNVEDNFNILHRRKKGHNFLSTLQNFPQTEMWKDKKCKEIFTHLNAEDYFTFKNY